MSLFLGYDMEPGLIPLVVGVASTAEGLEKAAAQASVPCDVVEIRLDLIGEDSCDWPVAALHLTQAGIGTLLTIRHVSEGGRWTGDEAARLDLYARSLSHVTGVDVELCSEILPDLVAAAKGRVTVIGSHHQFRSMPTTADLQKVVREGQTAGVDVIKLAAYATDKPELNRLLQVMKQNPDARICTLAMGPMGASSRIDLPLAGSCLTYGFLDKATAPGQPSAKDIREQLMTRHEEYRIFAEIRAGLGE